MNRILYYFLQWTSGLIQNLCGFVLYSILSLTGHRKNGFFRGARLIGWKLGSSMALGMYIFLGREDLKLLHHEYGHTLQSAMLGPLYIPLIGLPSLVWAGLPAFEKMREKKGISYYSFYCEKWADMLGKTDKR